MKKGKIKKGNNVKLVLVILSILLVASLAVNGWLLHEKLGMEDVFLPANVDCRSPDYYFDEAPRRNCCDTDCHCDGARTCSFSSGTGICYGTARWDPSPEVSDYQRALNGDKNLAGAELYSTNLAGANLQGADLEGADLYDANLAGANLEGADLEGADLRWANLPGANLKGANLEEAYLYGATGLTGEQKEYARNQGAHNVPA